MSRDDEDVLTEACQLNSHGFISNAIVPWIMEEYRNNASVSYPVAVEVAKEVVEEVTNVIRSGKLTPAKETNPELDEQLEIAFTRLAYRGDTCVSFRAYVERCWGEYAPNPQLYMSPYVAIVQSSGFGKSRLLRELSLMTSAETQGTMRVLYTCTRLGPSTGYPKATECLQKWLFGSNQTEMGLTSCLEAISFYAQKKWEDVGTEWKELFSNPNADLDVETALKGAQVEQECDNPMETAEGKGLVVLAIDEARTLLTETSGATNKFRMLRHALRKANARIAKRQRNAGVLAVLVDTHFNGIRFHAFAGSRVINSNGTSQASHAIPTVCAWAHHGYPLEACSTHK
ncbi:putative protein kinase domain-containing protein [Phytophthora infestans]|uniref:Uncharacterized protein n=1 Tax=Phytophthora infestans TaxID=4787 RepID=A0A833RXF6_PHYIN|nr:putative protein kinase domain-containing protein [Phytophthora infestans]